MTAYWEPLELKRPDRYLDWDVQNRPASKDRWCCALIQILLGPPDDPLANLKLFEKNIDDGVFGLPLSAPFKIHADEKRHVFNVISDFNKPGRALPRKTTFA